MRQKVFKHLFCHEREFNPAYQFLKAIAMPGGGTMEDRLPACLGRRASRLPMDAWQAGAKKDQAGSPIAETGRMPILRPMTLSTLLGHSPPAR